MNGKKQSEIKLRGLDPKVIAILDRYSDESGISRNTLLIAIITDYVTVKKNSSTSQKIEDCLNATLETIQQNTRILERVVRLLDDTMNN